MRTGKLYIDGNDAYLQYGVFVTEGGYNELVAYPPLKAPETNDWSEEDGIETDLESPVLDAREISVKFAITGVLNRYAAFIALLSDRAYHTFDFAEIQRTFRLRMTSCPSQGDIQMLGEITLKFSDDFPMEGYQYQAPATTLAKSDLYTIDGTPITNYGVRILKGTREELTKTAEPKKMLETTSAYRAGKTYDEQGEVHFKAKDIKMYCLIRAETLEDLWHNYLALLHDLIQPQERELYNKQLEQVFPFYYKSCSVTAFYPTEESWLQFTLTLTVTDEMRIDNDDIFILAAQNLDIIITERGEDAAVDLAPDKNSYPSCRLVNNRYTLRFTGNGAFRFNN